MESMIDMPWLSWDMKIRVLKGILSFKMSIHGQCGRKWEGDDEPGQSSIDNETLSSKST